MTDTTNQLSEELLKNQELAEELNQLRKEIEALEVVNRQSNMGGKSLADEMSEGDARKGEEVKQKDLEIEKLKEDLKQLQEENKQLKQKAAQNIGVDQPSSIDKEEVTEVEVRPDTPQNIMDWPVPKGLDFLQPEKTPTDSHIHKKKSSTATSSTQKVLTSDGGRDFFDKKQDIAGAELKSLPPETELSDPKPTTAEVPGKSLPP